MTTYDQIASKIIKEQELHMGPVAWFEAGKVKDLDIIDKKSGKVLIKEGADSRTVIDSLVGQYSKLFGRAATEVCKEAVTALVADLSPLEIPLSLK